jgi:cyclic dehypoxanthinyl futalosine synthase
MPDISLIREKILNEKRITSEEALDLLHHADLLDLGQVAHSVRQRLHPDPAVTFVVDRNINYTNGCVSGCRFCAFFRPPGHPDAYVISREALAHKIEETLDMGGTQILLQGGLNPNLGLDYYEELLRFIKSRFHIHIHGFSPPEIVFIATNAGISIQDALEKLISAGLNSIPGGGAEILVDDVRSRISPGKCTADQWLNVMEETHRLGLKTTATMMFGHIENPEQILTHLIKIRELQDRTGGFTAFIPWTFQPAHTQLSVDTAMPVQYLRVLAVSRLVLDNVPNIQASWVTQGDKIAQISLAFGANDLGSTMIEENVVAAAGVSFRLSLNDMVRMITGAGYRAVQRDCFYNPIKIHGVPAENTEETLSDRTSCRP